MGAVRAAGDMNGDGSPDLIVAQANGSQFVDLVFGSDPQAGLAPPAPLTVRTTGVGFVSGDQSVGRGDFNGDGVADVVIGTTSTTTNRFASIVLGGGDSALWTAPEGVTTLSDLQARAGGVTLDNSDFRAEGAVTVAGVDLNGDGYDDLVAGAANAAPAVIFGSAAWRRGETAAVTIPGALDGRTGFLLRSTANPENLSFNAIGDVNGDGYEDFLYASGSGLGTWDGSVAVVFGGASFGAGGTFDLASATQPGVGFEIRSGSARTLGFSASAVGDMNGDGYDDLLVGAPTADAGNGRGDSFVVFGGRSVGAAGAVDVDALNGINGFRAEGAEPGSASGFSVTGPGDVNGDGFADLGIGVRGGATDGRVIAAFGGDFTGAATHLGTAGDDILQATTKATTAAPHILNGRQGDDILESAGSAPTSPDAVVMIGGAGDDVLAVGSLAWRSLDGGSGTDRLVLNPYLMASNNLDLTNPVIGGRIAGIEEIDLGFNNRLTTRLPDLLDLSDETRVWKVLGDRSRVVVGSDETWTRAATPVVEDGVTFDSYSYKGATMLVQQGNQVLRATLAEEGEARVFTVTNANDSGAGSLRQAILDAKAGGSEARDRIDLSKIGAATIRLDSALPTLEHGNNFDFVGNALGTVRIDGQGRTSLFTVDGGDIRFTDLQFVNGLAKGGDAWGGGGGLGAGGAITVRSGEVSVDGSAFVGGAAHGGASLGRAGGGGNGANAGGRSASDGGDGDRGAGYGGTTGPAGGAHGATTSKDGDPGGAATSGGFGQGGGGAGGAAYFWQSSRYKGGHGGDADEGGFGGGGGGVYSTADDRGPGGAGKAGGFGASRGQEGVGYGGTSSGGEGGLGGGGAGLGGAIFVYAGGKLEVTDTSFRGNAATGGTGFALGGSKGGAIFALEGSSVSGAELFFEGNRAADGGAGGFDGRYGQALDNQDVYGVIRAATSADGAIEGGALSETLRGTAGADVIRGGVRGDDRLIGRAGDDELTGGGGHDVFVFRRGDGSDVVTDFTTATRNPSAVRAAEVDLLEFRGAGLTAETMLLEQTGGHTMIRFAGAPGLEVKLNHVSAAGLANLSAEFGNIRFHGETGLVDGFDILAEGARIDRALRKDAVIFLNDADNRVRGFDKSDDVINGQGGHDHLRGLGGRDRLRGGDGNDRLDGGRGADRLDGGDGDDVLRGGRGDDPLTGGRGDDLLQGGRGDDILSGGQGADVLEGGRGADVFHLPPGEGQDRIVDFEWGEDHFRLGAGLGFDDLRLEAARGGATRLVVAATDERLAILEGIRPGDLSAGDFLA